MPDSREGWSEYTGQPSLYWRVQNPAAGFAHPGNVLYSSERQQSVLNAKLPAKRAARSREVTMRYSEIECGPYSESNPAPTIYVDPKPRKKAVRKPSK